MTGRPRIILAGATGRTGSAVAHELARRDDVTLVACVAPSFAGTPTRPAPEGTPVAGSPDQLPANLVSAGDVLVDLSVAEAVADHLQWACDNAMHAVVGSTGLQDGVMESAGSRYVAAGLGVAYIPNFSIGAVLMMQVAAEVARTMESCEIVEMHHDTKRDAPSGTAIRTAQLVSAQRAGVSSLPAGSVDTPIHSIRLPGATAHQEVIFGAPGELLTIRHDAIDRSCYAGGVVLAASMVPSHPGLTIGLEQWL